MVKTDINILLILIERQLKSEENFMKSIHPNISFTTENKKDNFVFLEKATVREK